MHAKFLICHKCGLEDYDQEVCEKCVIDERDKKIEKVLNDKEL